MWEYLIYLREKYLPRHCGIKKGAIVDDGYGKIGVLVSPWIDKCGQVLVSFDDGDCYVCPHKLTDLTPKGGR